jgi:two-component system, NarL family, nitrate/nitrite response regulator NarL
MRRPASGHHSSRARLRVVPVRVLAADRQPLYLEGVARAIRRRVAFQLVGEVGDGRAALAVIERECPDVAVIDLRLAVLDGRRVLNAVVRDELRTRILLLAPSGDAAEAYGAIAAGAAGWLSKGADERELCAAIAAVARGDVALTPDAQTAIATEIRRRSNGAHPVLDDRERRVLALVAEGRSAGDIGRELHLSTGTVKSSLLKLYRRLDVSERAAAVAVALRRGLIE